MNIVAHPFADKFPLLPEEDLQELTESIRAHGLRQPIVLDESGRILDGRNRYRACQKAGVKPDYITYTGNDLAEYVIDCNTTRRHMSVGARAMATALILEEAGLRQDGRWAYGALSDSTHVSNSFLARLRQAGVILDYAPHLSEPIIDGTIAFRNAFEEANQIKASREAEKIAERNRRKAETEQARQEQARQQRLYSELETQNATQYLTYIEKGEMDIPTAYAAWMEATRAEREQQQALTHSRMVTMQAIQDGLNTFAGGPAYADVVWGEAYPYEAQIMPENARLTVSQIDTAIGYLTRLKTLINQNK